MVTWKYLLEDVVRKAVIEAKQVFCMCTLHVTRLRVPHKLSELDKLEMLKQFYKLHFMW